MKRGIVLAVLIAVGALSMAVTAYQAPQPAGLSPAALAATKIEKVKDNLYMITGSDPTDRDAFSRRQHRRLHHRRRRRRRRHEARRLGPGASSTRSRPSPTSR